MNVTKQLSKYRLSFTSMGGKSSYRRKSSKKLLDDDNDYERDMEDHKNSSFKTSHSRAYSETERTRGSFSGHQPLSTTSRNNHHHHNDHPESYDEDGNILITFDSDNEEDEDGGCVKPKSSKKSKKKAKKKKKGIALTASFLGGKKKKSKKEKEKQQQLASKVSKDLEDMTAKSATTMTSKSITTRTITTTATSLSNDTTTRSSKSGGEHSSTEFMEASVSPRNKPKPNAICREKAAFIIAEQRKSQDGSSSKTTSKNSNSHSSNINSNNGGEWKSYKEFSTDRGSGEGTRAPQQRRSADHRAYVGGFAAAAYEVARNHHLTKEEEDAPPKSTSPSRRESQGEETFALLKGLGSSSEELGPEELLMGLGSSPSFEEQEQQCGNEQQNTKKKNQNPHRFEQSIEIVPDCGVEHEENNDEVITVPASNRSIEYTIPLDDGGMGSSSSFMRTSASSFGSNNSGGSNNNKRKKERRKKDSLDVTGHPGNSSHSEQDPHKYPTKSMRKRSKSPKTEARTRSKSPKTEARNRSKSPKTQSSRNRSKSPKSASRDRTRSKSPKNPLQSPKSLKRKLKRNVSDTSGGGGGGSSSSNSTPKSRDSSPSKSSRDKRKQSHASALSNRNPARVDFCGDLSGPSSKRSSPSGVQHHSHHSHQVAMKKDNSNTSLLSNGSNRSSTRNSSRSSTRQNYNSNAEMQRLGSLVEVMMQRMELYEKQSESFTNASIKYNKQWKQMIEHAKNKKFAATMNGTGSDDDLAPQKPSSSSSIIQSLPPTFVQDQWISRLEEIQKDYQRRLAKNNIQLKILRERDTTKHDQRRQLRQDLREELRPESSSSQIKSSSKSSSKHPSPKYSEDHQVIIDMTEKEDSPNSPKNQRTNATSSSSRNKQKPAYEEELSSSMENTEMTGNRRSSVETINSTAAFGPVNRSGSVETDSSGMLSINTFATEGDVEPAPPQKGVKFNQTVNVATCLSRHDMAPGDKYAYWASSDDADMTDQMLHMLNKKWTSDKKAEEKHSATAASHKMPTNAVFRRVSNEDKYVSTRRTSLDMIKKLLPAEEREGNDGYTYTVGIRRTDSQVQEQQ